METTPKASSKNAVLIPLSIVIAGVLIAGALMYEPGAKKDLSANADGTSLVVPTLSIGEAPVLGEPDAPITMIIFGDYECPFCKQQADEVELKLRQEFVKTGKLKMAFKNFPLENIHPHARPAAIAATCAQVQGKFWEYHDALYDRQNELSEADFDFVQLAVSLGLDKVSFTNCLSDPKINERVTTELSEGVALGIRGTPASFINNVYIEGAYPYASFKKIIEEELKK